ncbi:MAG TPA: heparin lyase I family protein [Thermoleophilaceae bacterium]|nr:heparin lyase I family protein [Thermoleophilaceae bacterium]
MTLFSGAVAVAVVALVLAVGASEPAGALVLKHRPTGFTVHAPPDFRVQFDKRSTRYTVRSRNRRARLTYTRLRTKRSPAAIARSRAARVARSQLRVVRAGRRYRLRVSRRRVVEVGRAGRGTVAVSTLSTRGRRTAARLALLRRIGRSARGGLARNTGTTHGLSVAWRTPTAGQILAPGSAELRVDASTPSRVAEVRFLVDGEHLHTEYETPYTGVLDTSGLSAGLHKLRAVVVLRDGRAIVRNQTVAVRGAGSAGETSPAAGGGCASNALFEGGFEGGLDEWGNVQALGPRATIVQGGSFCGARHGRFEVRAGDVEPDTDSNRAEVAGPSFSDGDDLWFRHATKLAAGFPREDKWQIVSQWRSGDGSPPLALFVSDDLALSLRRGDAPYTEFWRGPVQTEVWTDLVFHIRFSRNPALGFVELWRDGRRQTMRNGAERMSGQTIKGSSGYVKLGYYRDPDHVGTGVVYHDNYLVGRSLADVAPAP